MKSKIGTTIVFLSIAGALCTQAALLVYEPFAYTSGDPSGTGVALNGQGTDGELGLTGTWTAQNVGGGGGGVPNSTTVYPEGTPTGITQNNNTANPNPFDGTVDNLPTSGGFFGVSNATNVDTWTNGTDHIEIWRPLAPDVTASFGTGKTTWFSFVSARGYSNNARSASFYIGAGNLIEDRGNAASAPGIGAGGSNSDGGSIFPQYWNNGLISNSGTADPSDGFVSWLSWTSTAAGSGPNIIVGKIQWNADTNGGDIISAFRFLKTDELSEEAFDAGIDATPLLSSANWPALSPDLDETTFNMVSIGGGRYFADEIRIATTFEEVIGNGAAAPARFRLTITPASPGYDLAWESKDGMLYNLRSSPDLTGELATWTLVEGDIPASGTGTNTWNVNPPETRLFYAVEEFPAPPVILLSQDFEADEGGFTAVTTGGTSWAYGAPISPDAGGGAVTSGNGGSAKCWGTDIGDPGTYVSGTETALRSPVIDLTDVPTATLSFAQAIDIAPGHTLEVYAIDPSGTLPDVKIHTSTPDSAPTKADWKTVKAVAITGGQPVLIEWRFIGNGNNDYLGAYIDDVVVTAP